MNRRFVRLSVLALAALALPAAALGVACTDNSGNYGLSGGGGSAGTMSGSGGAGNVSTMSTGGAGGGVGGIGGGCGNECATDLQGVVDCYGDPIPGMECPSDKGCKDAKCEVDPCTAAKEAKSSYGCDYWALKPGLVSKTEGACFAAFIANTWSDAVHINVEYDGNPLPMDMAYIPKGQGANITYEPYDAVAGLGKGEVAILFLARNDLGFVLPCPKPAAISTEVGVNDTGRGKAFHITTDRPVVAYQIIPYGGAPSALSSATLLLPTSAWDVNYVAVNAYKNSTIEPDASPFIDIVASEDNTKVSILPSADIVGGPGVDPAMKNVKMDYILQRGEFLQIEQPEELTGSPIASDKPIGVWGGHSNLYVPVDKTAGDPAQQQLSPVKAMGSEYAAVRHRGRGGQDEVVPWRIVGAVDGTELTWDPAAPAGVPEKIDRGTVVDFTSTGPFIVKSQSSEFPFHLSEYMTGGESFNAEGDPEWINVVPPAQYLKKYVFFTDPSYSETNLVIIRTRSKFTNEFVPVTLDCVGELPKDGWQPLGPYEYTKVDLVTGNFQDVGSCSNGRHEMSSAQPFGVTVWGWGTKAATPPTKSVSYAYPAGASIKPINKVEVVPDPQ